jgi:hypothetical protein
MKASPYRHNWLLSGAPAPFCTADTCVVRLVQAAKLGWEISIVQVVQAERAVTQLSKACP